LRQELAQIAIVVRDYDEAIQFFTEKLHFNLISDQYLSETKRWVIVKPPSAQGAGLILAKAASPKQQEAIGNQTGGRVFLFLHTDDFWRDYQDYKNNGIEFVRDPSREEYGTVAVFKDLYGNLWDLIGP
jgi:catechol 2,3-dioxygenase-like lactoylglutathione lyase family enzyme